MEKHAEETLEEGDDDDDDEEEEGHNYNVKPKTKSPFGKKETRKVKALSNHLNNKRNWIWHSDTLLVLQKKQMRCSQVEKKQYP